jgi:hypothetical protein
VAECSIPNCKRPARANGRCTGHEGQRRRAEARGEVPVYSALRGRHGQRGPAPLVLLPGIRVPPEVADALERRGPTRQQAARAVLTEWHRRQR